MLKNEMIQRLNKQLNLEFYSSNLYMQMSAWCDYYSFNGIARFLRGHAKEEGQHMQRLFDYLLDTGAMPLFENFEAPPQNYKSLLDLFEKVYSHEILVTEKINELVDYALTSKDYPTFNFLQWYVAEQHEEEKLFKTLLDKLQLVGENNKEALFFVDKDFDRVVSQSTNVAQNK